MCAGTNGYLLSPKDLCTIDYLSNLPNVTSLKIEGRMKSPEYVATVVSSYRRILDSAVVEHSVLHKNNDVVTHNVRRYE